MEYIVIEPTELANKLAMQSLFDYGKSLLLEIYKDSKTVIDPEDVKNLVLDSDGEVKSDYFDYYTNSYDYYFKVLTDSHIEK